MTADPPPTPRDFGPCPTCDGRGWIACRACGGTGHVGYCRMGSDDVLVPCGLCDEGQTECPYCGGPETVEVPLEDEA